MELDNVRPRRVAETAMMYHAESSGSELHVPATLLSNVMERIDEQEESLQHMTELSEAGLVEMLHHTKWNIRVAAVDVLASQGVDAPLDLLLFALHDEHTMVRVAAVQALGQLGMHIPFEQFVIALQDQAWQVREMVVLTLGELLPMQAEIVSPLLNAALQDPYSAVRESAQMALDRQAQWRRAVEPALVVPVSSVRSLAVRLQIGVEHLYLVQTRQILLILCRWKIPALLLFSSYVLILFVSMWFDRSVSHEGTTAILAFVSVLSTGLGIAFTADTGQDAGLEIELSTPTSLRQIQFCRFLTIVGINVLLAGCASVLIAILYSQGLWSVVQFWLGPLFVVSTLVLALTILVGSWCVSVGFALFTLAKIHYFGSDSPLLIVHMSPLWQIILTLFSLLFVYYYIPRQVENLKEQD